MLIQVPISFALHLSLGEESLDKTLDYSHHSTNLPPGATLADEADNSKAKVYKCSEYLFPHFTK